MDIRQLVEIKGPDIVSVPPRTSVREVSKLLKDKHIGCVIVMDGQERIKGIAQGERI